MDKQTLHDVQGELYIQRFQRRNLNDRRRMTPCLVIDIPMTNSKYNSNPAYSMYQYTMRLELYTLCSILESVERFILTSNISYPTW